MCNDMSNDNKRIYFSDITRGIYFFRWPVAQSYLFSTDYQLAGGIQDVEGIDSNGPWLLSSEDGKWSTPLKDTPSLYPLHREFGALEGKEQDIIKFANQHGSLGKDVILFPPPSGGIVRGESLERWKNEIAHMGVCLTVWDLFKQKEAGKLGQIVKWTKPNRVMLLLGYKWEKDHYAVLRYPDNAIDVIESVRSGALLGTEGDTLLDSDYNIHPDLVKRWHYGDVLEPAFFWLCQEINKKLEGGIYPQIFPFTDKKVYLTPENLLSAMWLMFMWEVTGEKAIEKCPACGDWFEQVDPREHYCTKACKQKAYRDRSKSKTDLNKETQSERERN